MSKLALTIPDKDKDDVIANCSVAELISDDFNKHIDRLFEKTGVKIFNKRLVQLVIKSYYVKVDLVNGSPIGNITYDRLDEFHTLLWGYLVHAPADSQSIKLFELVDEAIAKIKTIINHE